MKALTNTSSVVDAWAHQDRAAGKSGTVSFDGPRLFSYQTPIAAIVTRTVDAHAPLRVCLTTYRRHSVTTSGHIAQARTAAQQAGLSSIAVADISAPLDHQRNLLGIAEDAAGHLRKAAKARVHSEGHTIRAKKRMSEALLYAKFFGIAGDVPVCELAPIEEWIAALQASETV